MIMKFYLVQQIMRNEGAGRVEDMWEIRDYIGIVLEASGKQITWEN